MIGVGLGFLNEKKLENRRIVFIFALENLMAKTLRYDI